MTIHWKAVEQLWCSSFNCIQFVILENLSSLDLAAVRSEELIKNVVLGIKYYALSAKAKGVSYYVTLQLIINHKINKVN